MSVQSLFRKHSTRTFNKFYIRGVFSNASTTEKSETEFWTGLMSDKKGLILLTHSVICFGGIFYHLQLFLVCSFILGKIGDGIGAL